MTLNDQAFVKSFSRRRLADPNRQSSLGVPLPNQSLVSDQDRSLPSGAPAEPSEHDVWTPPTWSDPTAVDGPATETSLARADQARIGVPRPHIEGRSTFRPEVNAPEVSERPASETTEALNSPGETRTSSTDPLQHIHTAYAGAFADPSLFDTPSTSDNSVQVAREPVVNLRVDMPASVERSQSSNTFVPFQAVWEVDVFDVPTPVADLFFEGALFQQIAERMSDAVSSGLKCVLVTSSKPGEGRSSVAMGMAMAAAAAGIRVALVDADIESPSLADELRLELQYGWVDVIRRGLPIKEVAVHAVEDGVTLIPLMPASTQPAATAFEMVQLMDLLKSSFELVIVDGPTGLSSSLQQLASRMDSAVIVRDLTRTDESTTSEFAQRLHSAGIRGIGVVENFV